MILKTLADKVLVKRDEAKTISDSGIIIPNIAIEQSDQGIVLAIGKGKSAKDGTFVQSEVKINDRILFKKNCGTEVTILNEKLLVLKEEDILGIFQ